MEVTMTLDDFAEKLSDVEPGQGARVPYELYAELFPPGEPSQDARGAAFDFANANDCEIENRPDDSAVWFYKEA